MRFKVLDSWRGIAALLVATYHFEAASHIHDIAFFAHCFLFVDFFFVLSGFVIAHAYAERIGSGRQLAGFVVRRFGRIYPLHAAVLAAFVTIELLKLILSKGLGIQAGTPAFDPTGYTPLGALPGHFALTTAIGISDTLTWNGPDWSISGEFWTYLVFGIVVLASGAWRLPVIALTGAIAGLWLATHAKHGIDATYDLGFVRCLYGFMLGSLVFAARRHLGRVALASPAVIEAGTIAGVIAFMTLAGRSQVSFLAPFVFAAATFVFSFEQGPVSRLMSRPSFQKLGDWSYSIYMVHAFVWFVLGMGISVLGRKYGFEPWRIVGVGDLSRRELTFASPYLLDVLLAGYLATVLSLASLTKRWIEDPGREYFAHLADRIARREFGRREPGVPQPLKGL